MNDAVATGTPDLPAQRQSVTAVFLAFLQLGMTSFGGPIAHLGYFRDAFVVRRRWIDERAYADLVALCQFLPGPASSQIGIGIGLAKAGLPGAFAAWFAFTVPSALALLVLGYGVVAFQDATPGGVLHGLKVVAVAVVAQAVWGMARVLCPDAPRATLAVLGAGAVLAAPTPLVQISVIVGRGLAGLALLRAEIDPRRSARGIAPSFLLIVGALPFWDALRHLRLVQKALLGVNAAVVGLLLAALYNPIWTSGILLPGDFALALAAFTLLVFWKVPPWLVVILTAAGGWGVQALAGFG
jgi:chromate transporter